MGATSGRSCAARCWSWPRCTWHAPCQGVRACLPAQCLCLTSHTVLCVILPVLLCVSAFVPVYLSASHTALCVLLPVLLCVSAFVPVYLSASHIALCVLLPVLLCVSAFVPVYLSASHSCVSVSVYLCVCLYVFACVPHCVCPPRMQLSKPKGPQHASWCAVREQALSCVQVQARVHNPVHVSARCSMLLAMKDLCEATACVCVCMCVHARAYIQPSHS